MLESAPSVDKVLTKFIDFIVDHNVNFDINFLYDTLFANFNFKLGNNYLDLMRLSRKIYPEFENHKLKIIATNLNVSLDNNHRAFGIILLPMNAS